jgi:NADP-dependent 3-hydroxy acid dehydrogenase YdfG
MDLELTDKITGAGTGIGPAVARALSAAGAHVGRTGRVGSRHRLVTNARTMDA